MCVHDLYMCVHDLCMYIKVCVFACMCACINICMYISVLFIECNFNYSYNYLQVEHGPAGDQTRAAVNHPAEDPEPVHE